MDTGLIEMSDVDADPRRALGLHEEIPVMTLEECAPGQSAKPSPYLARYARHFEAIRRGATGVFEMGIYGSRIDDDVAGLISSRR